MKYFFLLILSFFLQISVAQYLEQYESENYFESGEITTSIVQDTFIYTGVKALDHGYYRHPIIRKLDFNGNIIWSTSIPDENSYGSITELLYSFDGFIYALKLNAPTFPELWKVDASSGEIIYRKDFELSGEDEYDKIKGLRDYNTDTLLLVFEREYDGNIYDYELAYLDKEDGTVLSTKNLVMVHWSNRDFDIIIPDEETIYYSEENTIYKSNPVNLDSVQWSTPIPSIGEADFRKLYYEASTNHLYALGGVSPSERGIVYCLDALTGEVVWDAITTTFEDIDFVDYVIQGNFLYITWTSVYTSADHIITSKVDKSTGEVLWETEHEFGIGNDNGSHRVKNIAIDDTGLYLTGHINSFLWGLMKLRKSDGSIKFSKTLFESGKGYLVLPVDDEVITLGTKQFLTNNKENESYARLNKYNGAINSEKEIGGNARLPSSTVSIEQINDNEFAVLQQRGSYAHFSVRDIMGNIHWDYNFLLNDFIEASYMKVVHDSLILVGGIGYLSAEEFFSPASPYFQDYSLVFINPITREVTIGEKIDDNAVKVIDVIYDNDENIYTAVLTKSGTINIYRLDYNDGNWELNNADYIGGFSFDEEEISSKVLVDLNQNSFLFSTIYSIYEMDKSTMDLSPSIPTTGHGRLSNIGKIQDSLIITTGKHFSNDTLKVLRININSLTVSGIYDITNLEAKGIKWVEGENNATIYILSTNDSEAFVSKFNINNNTVLWTKSISFGSPDFPLVNPSDIVFNLIEGYITVTGRHESLSGDNSQVFLASILENGTIISDITRGGNYAGNNEGLVLETSTTDDVTLVGGQIELDSTFSSAFIFYTNEEVLLNRIISKVFLDLNENGVQDAGEENTAIGHFIIDDDYELFLNIDGIAQTIESLGSHTIEYVLPPDWLLTTDSLIYQINVDTSSLDTLCFGIKPINVVDEVLPFMHSEALVCFEDVPFYLQIKNSGTSTQSLFVELDYDGTYNNASPVPDSISNNTMYWFVENSYPGQSQLFSINFQMPSVDNIGDSINFEARILLYDVTEQTITDTFEYAYNHILLCSYDPNDKLVTPVGIGEEDLTLFDQYLNYTIRFQNTGNYPARDIIIRDTLDSNLDLSTFEFLSASHPITEVRKNEDALTFVFDNIFLPDSISNEPASHGFVNFRIKPIDGLPENTLIENTAHIYFDYNPAIVTNTTQNTLVSEIFISTSNYGLDKSSGYTIFPNPSNGKVIIKSLLDTIEIRDWKLYDILGRQLFAGQLKSQQEELDLSSIKNGIYLLEIDAKNIFKIIVQHQ